MVLLKLASNLTTSEIERRIEAIFGQFGISRVAVKPNLEESQSWLAEFKRIHSEYDSRIGKPKENLLPR